MISGREKGRRIRLGFIDRVSIFFRIRLRTFFRVRVVLFSLTATVSQVFCPYFEYVASPAS